MKVYYLYHSGFAVETSNYKFIFDFYKAPTRNIGDFNLEEFLKGNKKIVVFSTHSHGDHFNKEILNWKKINENIDYVFSNDIVATGDNITYMGENEYLKLYDIQIKSFGSTDLGLSFFIEADNETLFHSGDLNWWYWEGEDTKEEEIEMENNYKRIIENIKNSINNKAIDCLFYPVDPRLGKNRFMGVDYFIENLRVKKLIPMHLWDDYEIYEVLKKRYCDRGIEVIKIKNNMSEII